MSKKMSKADKLAAQIATLKQQMAEAEAAERQARERRIVRAATRAGALSINIDQSDLEAAFRRLVGAGGNGNGSEGAA